MDGRGTATSVGTYRRAKIVATLGPASNTEETFRQLLRAGLDVARLNFSHGSHEQKTELIAMVRKVAREENKPICILADLQGPKIRTGALVGHVPVLLTAGRRLVITPDADGGHGRAREHGVYDAGRKPEARRSDSFVGWIDRAARGGDCGRGCGGGDRQRRIAGREEGDQPAGRGDQSAVADREGRGRPGVLSDRPGRMRWRCRLCRPPTTCAM